MTSLTFSVTALALVALTSAAWFRRLRRVAIPDDRFVFLSLWGLGALIGAAGLVGPGAGWASGTVGALAVLGGTVMVVLDALGKQRTDKAIEVGQAMPAFSGIDERHQTFDSASLAGTLSLIKFFRGHW
jgi:hypothetical protein